MIRASGGDSLELFENSGCVAIGFNTPVDLSKLDRDGIRDAYLENNPDDSRYKAGGATGMLHRLASQMEKGDRVITYDPSRRIYLVGTITSDYQFERSDSDLRHRRQVKWETKTVGRDDLKSSTRNSLGSTLTLFRLNDSTLQDIETVLSGGASAPDPEDEEDDFEEEKENQREIAREKLKDRIVRLDDRDMEQLMAAVLRGMGFRATVSPVGPDRGVDVIASPDGLGLQEPRIKVEVKHRRTTQMPPAAIRSFIGALRAGDRGIYLSTGGFSREAKYEAERANIPITLLDLDGLARLIENHYENFDADGRTLLPLIRVLWPAD